MLNKEYILLHSSLHLIKHYMSMRYIYDIRLIVERYDIDWDEIVGLSKQYRISHLMCYVLSICTNLFDASVPNKVVSKLRIDSDRSKLLILNRINFTYEDYPDNKLKCRTFFLLQPNKLNVKVKYFRTVVCRRIVVKQLWFLEHIKKMVFAFHKSIISLPFASQTSTKCITLISQELRNYKKRYSLLPVSSEQIQHLYYVLPFPPAALINHW